MSAVDWMMRAYPEAKECEGEEMRRITGRYGLTDTQQVFHNTYIMIVISAWNVLKLLLTIPLA